MSTAQRFMIFMLMNTAILYNSLHSYTIQNLNDAAEKGDIISASGMVKRAITPHSLPQLEPKALKDILDADQFDGSPLTIHIISAITTDNLNKLEPIVIRHLLMKANEAAAQHIVKILQENRQMLLKINPKLLYMFLITANNGHAQKIARLITPETLIKIDPSIIVELIKANYREVGAILIPLVTYENITYLDPAILDALSHVKGYARRINQINQQLEILAKKNDMEKFMNGLKKKRSKKL